MFGQQDDNQSNDHIPEQSIDGVLSGVPGNTTGDGSAWQHPGTPLDQGNTAPQTVAPAGAPAVDDHAAAQSPTDDHANAQTAPHDLIDIKQKALTQLSPLVGHLEQSPEEKFRTTMMMIQASDDQSLVPVAYEAANAIQDEKAKAQALLDIVNEINYFTSQHHQS